MFNQCFETYIYICDTGGHWRSLIDMREMDKLVEAQAEPLTSRCLERAMLSIGAAWKLTSRVDIGVDNLKSTGQHYQQATKHDAWMRYLPSSG